MWRREEGSELGSAQNWRWVIHRLNSLLGLGSFFFLNIYLFIWLHQVLIVAHGIFSCGMWDLVPWPGIELRSPALGAQSLSHGTTRVVRGLGSNRMVLGLRLVSPILGNRLVFSLDVVVEFRVKRLGGKSNLFLMTFKWNLPTTVINIRQAELVLVISVSLSLKIFSYLITFI